jgi:hypothetical protein
VDADAVQEAAHLEGMGDRRNEKTLAKSAKLEFTLASGEGGKGSICLDDLTFAELPPQDDSPLTTHALAHR